MYDNVSGSWGQPAARKAPKNSAVNDEHGEKVYVCVYPACPCERFGVTLVETKSIGDCHSGSKQVVVDGVVLSDVDY